MFQLMKKNSSYLIQLLVLLPILALAWFIKTRPLSSYQIFMGGMWMILAVLGGAINGEMIEDKMKGYAFLRTLPIKDKDVVKSKFLMAGVTAALIVVFLNIMLLFLSGPAYLFSLGRISILVFAGFVLLLVACLYILAFRIGFSRFIKIAWATFFILILTPILIMEFVLRKLDGDYVRIIESVVSLPWPVWAVLVAGFLAVYYGLMTLAVKAKEAAKG